MIASHFFSLPISLQEQYLNFCGERIGEIEERHCYTSLYLIGNFYVEVFSTKETGELLNVIMQDDTEVYLLYLKKLCVDIPFIMNS